MWFMWDYLILRQGQASYTLRGSSQTKCKEKRELREIRLGLQALGNRIGLRESRLLHRIHDEAGLEKHGEELKHGPMEVKLYKLH